MPKKEEAQVTKPQQAAGWTWLQGQLEQRDFLYLLSPLFWVYWLHSRFLQLSLFIQEGKDTIMLELISSCLAQGEGSSLPLVWKTLGGTCVEHSAVAGAGCVIRSEEWVLLWQKPWPYTYSIKLTSAHLPLPPAQWPIFASNPCCSEPGNQSVASGSISQNYFPHHPSPTTPTIGRKGCPKCDSRENSNCARCDKPWNIMAHEICYVTKVGNFSAR